MHCSRGYPLAALVLPVLLAPHAQAANQLSLRDLSFPEGSMDNSLHVHCNHDVAILGFSVSILYDPAIIRVTGVSEGTSVEGTVLHLQGTHDGGEISYGAILDLDNPLPPALNHRLFKITFDVLASEGAITAIRFVDGLGPQDRGSNVLTDATGNSVKPSLGDGSITITEADLRPASLRAGGPARIIDDGRRAIVFDGEVIWGFGLEDGMLTSLRFTASGNGDESRLLGGISLYLDDNGSGSFEDEDRQVGTGNVAADDAPVAFEFMALVPAGEGKRFFLVAEVASPAGTQASVLILPALVVLGGLGLLARRRARRLSLFLVLVFSISGLSCGGGGGGGGGQAAPAGEVRFDIRHPSDVGLHGAPSGLPASLSGLPVSGPILRL